MRSAFTRKYNAYKLVYYGVGNNIYSAIAGEKQIKGGSLRYKDRFNQKYKSRME